MKNIHIENSYKIWDTFNMQRLIDEKCYQTYNSPMTDLHLNRSYRSMYIEWWLHNIGYYITKPFCFIELFRKINLRCKDVDINELAH